MAPGSVLVTFGQTKVLCTASVEERCRLDAGQRQGLGHRRVLDAAGLDAGAGLAGGRQGQAVGPDPGDPAPDRALAARRVRPRHAGRGADHRRLRRRSRPTAARAPRPSAAGMSRCTTPAPGWSTQGRIGMHPLTDSVAAVSVGIIDGVPMLDLPYAEDSRAEVDMNVVMTGAGRFVEVQGTAEGMAFTAGELDSLLGLAEAGIKELIERCRPPCWPSRRRRGERARRRRCGSCWRRPTRTRLRRSSPSCGSRSDRAPAAPGRGARRRRGRRHPGRQRPAEGAAFVTATGLAAVADDTGLYVDALDGAPGVYSARYAGEDATYADNVAKLLASSRRCDDGAARGARSRPRRSWPFPTVRAVGRGRGRRLDRHGAARGTTASATTRCSCPRGRRPDLRRDDPAEKARDPTGAARSVRWPTALPESASLNDPVRPR